MKHAPLAVALLFAVLAVIWLGRDRTLALHAWPAGSSYGTGEAGASQLRGVLAEQGVQVSALTRPLRHAGLPRDAVLFRIAPGLERLARPEDPTETQRLDGGTDAPGKKPPPDVRVGLTPDEEDFVRDGGRLILAAAGDLLEDASRTQKVVPLLPGVTKLAPPTPRALPDELLLDALPVFEHDTYPAIAVRRLGRGEAWLLAEPALLLNEHLAEGDHLALGLALAGSGRPVYFDEAVHGDEEAAGTLELLRRWGLGPALLLGALALLGWFWRAATTLGPPADDYRESRTEAVDLVDSMAALYETALSPDDAVALYRSQLVREIALRKALSERSAEELVRKYAPGFDVAPDFRSRLTILNEGFTRLRDERRR